jgi:hypothetical protein
MTITPDSRWKRGRHPKASLATLGDILAAASPGVVVYRLGTGRRLGWLSAGLGIARPLTRSWLRPIARRSGLPARAPPPTWSSCSPLRSKESRGAGRVREGLIAAGNGYWDWGDNEYGWRSPDGAPGGYGYNLPEDKGDPDRLASIFRPRAGRLPWITPDGSSQHEVIMFKSCFPLGNIADDSRLRAYREDDFILRRGMDRHADKLFIVVTPPPLNPSETSSYAARCARAFAAWLHSRGFFQQHPIAVTFDLLGALSEPDGDSPEPNMLRQEPRQGLDSRLNELANQEVGCLSADFILRSTAAYSGAQADGSSAARH